MKRRWIDPHWRKARLGARLLLKMAAGQIWSDRDRRVAALLVTDEGVSNRLLDQGWNSVSARQTNGYCILSKIDGTS